MYSIFYNILEQCLALPELYKETEGAFWDDTHISRQMLTAHLNPDFEGASRTWQFIDRSAAWITETLPPDQYASILDAGCGPGLYSERFVKAGYNVTGIDFSKRSIEYAEHSALSQNLQIDYRCMNYLDTKMDKTFDCAALIYCDYGALSESNRRVLLRNLYNWLNPGGKLLLDVFSMETYRVFEEAKNWQHQPYGGFWKDEPHFCMHLKRKYEPKVTLEQTTVISRQDVKTYYLWNTYFTCKTLTEELEKAGFTVTSLFSDVAGSPYQKDSRTLTALSQK